MAGESAPDAPLACVLSNFSSTVGLEFVLAASGCGAPGATPAGVEGPTPHEAAVASPGEMEGVAPGEDFPPPCGGGLAFDDGFPVPDKEDAAPFHDGSSSRKLYVFSYSLPWIFPAGCPADVAGTSPDQSTVESTPHGDAPPSCEKTPPSLIDDVSRHSDRCHRKIPFW